MTETKTTMPPVSSENDDLALDQKLLLSVPEAAKYSNLGVKTIYRLLKQDGCPFVLRVGPYKRMVKRKEFEEYLSNNSQI